MNWLSNLRNLTDPASELQVRDKILNRILKSIVTAVRSEFKGPVTYSSGTWESVDWSMFDIVGVDYYYNGEPTDDYISGLERYKLIGKPVVVMETGCCTYKGAFQKGSFGFSVLQGVDDDGQAIYEGGIVPIRDENEQAKYISFSVDMLKRAEADGVFFFVFAFPIYPHRTKGVDLDMTSYALVKSYPQSDSRSQEIPAWCPKQGFYRLGAIYNGLSIEK